MGIKEKIESNLKAAMKAQDETKNGFIEWRWLQSNSQRKKRLGD